MVRGKLQQGSITKLVPARKGALDVEWRLSLTKKC